MMQKYVLIIGAILHALERLWHWRRCGRAQWQPREHANPIIRQFCSDVAPGQGRIKSCMKAHLRELSEPCKEALFQAWLAGKFAPRNEVRPHGSRT